MGVIVLERVQKIATRMMPGVECLSYETRMVRPGLFSLQQRKLRDNSKVHKIMMGIDKIYCRNIPFVRRT